VSVPAPRTVFDAPLPGSPKFHWKVSGQSGATPVKWIVFVLTQVVVKSAELGWASPMATLSKATPSNALQVVPAPNVNLKRTLD
jgi:hypothetical protein